MLILDLAITAERDSIPIHSSRAGERSGYWMSFEIEGKLAVVLDTLSSDRVSVWTLVS